MVTQIDLNSFDYALPEEKIAFFPLEERSGSRLMVVNKNDGSILDSYFHRIGAFIPGNSLVVFNDTKVIAARLAARKPSGGKAEILLVDPVEPFTDPLLALNTKSTSVWNCIIGGKRIETGSSLFAEGAIRCHVVEKKGNEALVRFEWDSGLTFGEMIDTHGSVPLPPYIRREAQPDDKGRYQSVFAKYEGSVAAPTASLHFTDEIIKKLKDKGTEAEYLTLHVGLGTFKPIEKTDISEHVMHKELISVTLSCVKNIHSALSSGRNIMAVGTTSLRTLESLYWTGHALLEGNAPDSMLLVTQWYPYGNSTRHEPAACFEALTEYMKNSGMEKLQGYTQLLIVPGYEIRTANALVTNFHAPKSTLVLLTAAALGTGLWRKAYDHALENGYRFLSYGDSSLLQW